MKVYFHCPVCQWIHLGQMHLPLTWFWAMGCKYKWCISLLDQSIQKLVNILSKFCMSPCWSTTFPVTQLAKEFIGTQREIFVALCHWNFKPNFFSQHSHKKYYWYNISCLQIISPSWMKVQRKADGQHFKLHMFKFIKKHRCSSPFKVIKWIHTK